MKIAILSPVAWRTPPRHYGPWEQMASNLCEGLVAAGMEVTLFATADAVTKARLESVVAKGYEEDRSQDAKVVECLHIAHFMEQSSSFDIVHNHFDFLPLTYSKLINRPMVTTIHGFSSERIVAVYKRYNANNHYVSISNANRHPELNYFATIYNGLNSSSFSFNPVPADYLLFFGRLHPDKGAADAIAIAKRTQRKLIIAGIIQDEAYFESQVAPHLNDDIVFIGAAGPEKRNELLGNAAALLHSIHFDEPFGLSVAEAMLCGTPVIAYNRGSMPELIVHQKTGFLVKDINEAAEAVNEVHKLNRMEARKWALSMFTTEKMTADYIACYHQLLNG